MSTVKPRIFPRMEITATNRENQRSVARANSTILVVHITGANEFYPRWVTFITLIKDRDREIDKEIDRREKNKTLHYIEKKEVHFFL